jgi:hypothetical protein
MGPSVFYLMLDRSGGMAQDPFTLAAVIEPMEATGASHVSLRAALGEDEAHWRSRRPS